MLGFLYFYRFVFSIFSVLLYSYWTFLCKLLSFPSYSIVMILALQKRLLERENPARIHLIGVAGSGMSGLALMLLEMGHRVSGSDRVTSDETERLKSLGLMFSSPHSPDAVSDADIVIYSSAIKEDNPDLMAGRAAHIPCFLRAQCLAAILNNKRGIVVSGTHGKTTTSALCAHILREGRKRPCHYVGAEIPVLGTNAHWNDQSDYLVAEGDESDGTLVNYLPEHSIVLNVEAEHLDHYKNLDEIKDVFAQLCAQTRGKIFYCAVDAGAMSVCSVLPNAVSYGWANADVTASGVEELRGRTLFVLNYKGQEMGQVELGIPGRHNVLNALAAVAVALELGVDFESISRALSTFAGARRRFETKYLTPHGRIIDDYGHHPTEIAATLQTARSLSPRRIVVLFQPHRYTRTQLLADEFGRVLQAADVVYVSDVYPASEMPIPGISGETIVEAARRQGPVEIHSCPDLATAHIVVGNALRLGDLLVTLGAGNVHEAGTKIARDLVVLEELVRFSGMTTPIRARLYELMSKHTTMKVGGAAQFWFEPDSAETFAGLVNYCRDRGIPVTVVGRGSNMIVRRGGIRGAVICPKGGDFDVLEVHGTHITAGAGVKLKKVAALAAAHGIAGFEWMDGIPGNVGGSLRMNAGAMGRECIDSLLSVTCLNERGEVRERERDSLEYSYRTVNDLKRNYVIKAVFHGEKGDAAEIQTRMEESRQKRKFTQPVEPSAGCVFKNTVSMPAGKLIDELGLKGLSIGDAEISLLHGNFIINKGNATAIDVLALVDMIKEKAQKECGVDLEMEAQIVGDREYGF